jgi:hypothetical protein
VFRAATLTSNRNGSTVRHAPSAMISNSPRQRDVTASLFICNAAPPERRGIDAKLSDDSAPCQVPCARRHLHLLMGWTLSPLPEQR